MAQPPLEGAPRVGVLVVAYNAASTLERTLSRLPEQFAASVDHVLVCDDASVDDTYEIGMRFSDTASYPVTVIKHERNLGYGGNQKAGYRWAIAHGLEPACSCTATASTRPSSSPSWSARWSATRPRGVRSRMLGRGGARWGGMPTYKYVGNRVLTPFQNALTGLRLSEWHSGYRAYDRSLTTSTCRVLRRLRLRHRDHPRAGARRKRIVEVPIPTYYGDEICYVNGLSYARDVTADVLRHWASDRGFGGGVASTETDLYALKVAGSHGVLLEWLQGREPSRVLDAGCFDGRFADLARGLGHHVTGLDRHKHDGVAERVSSFIEADLTSPSPPASRPSTTSCCRRHPRARHGAAAAPQRPRLEARPRWGDPGVGAELRPLVPPRPHRVGKFDYDQRGPLDRGHVRFFTRTTIERLFAESGLRVLDHRTVGTPFESVIDGPRRPRVVSSWCGGSPVPTGPW